MLRRISFRDPLLGASHRDAACVPHKKQRSGDLSIVAPRLRSQPATPSFGEAGQSEF
jgi:hypothetical protein